MLVKIELASLAVFHYLFRIFETQPWLTRNWREITQGRTPAAAISMIFRRMWLGNGRPLMNTPPNWFTLPWPEKSRNLENVTNQPISDIAANPFWTLGWRWEDSWFTTTLRKTFRFFNPRHTNYSSNSVNESGQIALFPLLPNDCNYRHTAASSYCSTAAWTVGHPIPTILRCIFLYSFGFYLPTYASWHYIFCFYYSISRALKLNKDQAIYIYN